MGDGSRDLQIPWHEFFGEYFQDETILDVGSALGNSKPRLEKGNNVVTTQELNPKFADRVDITDGIKTIKKKFSAVTAFEVLEHTEEYDMDKVTFLNELKRLSTKFIFVTTPNRYVCPAEWHMYPEEFLKLIEDNFDGCEVKFFCRFGGEVKEISYEDWMAERVAHQMGILLIKKVKNVKSKKGRSSN